MSSKIGKPIVPKISEDQLQKQVAAYLDLKYPNILWFHVPNGGSRNFFEAVKLKAMGVKPGVPDIMIFNKQGPYSGLYVELKVGKNKPNDNQLAMHKKLEDNGWRGCVVWTFDDARTFIDGYLSGKLVP